MPSVLVTPVGVQSSECVAESIHRSAGLLTDSMTGGRLNIQRFITLHFLPNQGKYQNGREMRE